MIPTDIIISSMRKERQHFLLQSFSFRDNPSQGASNKNVYFELRLISVIVL